MVILVGYWAAFACIRCRRRISITQAVGVPPDWPYHYSGLAAHWNKNSNLAWAFDTWFLNLFPRAKPFTHNGGGYATLSFIPTLGTMILGLIAGGWLKHGPLPLEERRLAGADRRHSPRRRPGASMKTASAPASSASGRPPGRSTAAAGASSSWPRSTRSSTPAGLAAWSFPLRVIGANSIAAYLLAHGPDGFIIRSFHIHFGPKVFELFGPAYEPLVAGPPSWPSVADPVLALSPEDLRSDLKAVPRLRIGLM